jgi:hypothetical protein
MKLAAASFIFFGVHRVFAAGFPNLSARVLPTFLDTLIPADESPSATDLQVDKKLLEKIAQDPAYKKLVDYECLWLEQKANSQYQRSFWQLDTQQRDAIVTLLASKRPSSIAYQIFFRVQRDVFAFYYSDQASWHGLTLRQPPQPEGYADYDRPPV